MEWRMKRTFWDRRCRRGYAGLNIVPTTIVG
jgi:hypothetical protein